MSTLIEMAQAGWMQEQLTGSRYRPLDCRSLDEASRRAFDAGYETAMEGQPMPMKNEELPEWATRT